jgi:hypothetical protein
VSSNPGYGKRSVYQRGLGGILKGVVLALAKEMGCQLIKDVQYRRAAAKLKKPVFKES